ncbi:hypothetical protein CSQ85_07710 [Bifidobacterium rousetti]|uniref:hypothetical protein n=1 Tax=Bifidobacterium rousetti TaxID=2045439 RepID=UPI00123BEDAD|nr:hypothetical protein [Bifidobacterium rousetti]KAA8818744.1 hypothetical protein CSQ85_07710 [Bifidobacterium rousetti]
MYEDVDFLQQSSQYYFIDYIPYDTNDPSFLELEEYFENTYIGLFAEKISRILLKIMYYKSCQVYLTRPENPTADYEYDKDIRSYPPQKMDSVIKKVIIDDFASLQVMLDSPRVLISVCGGFSVTIYGLKKEMDLFKVCNQLAIQEGLFLKYGTDSNTK